MTHPSEPIPREQLARLLASIEASGQAVLPRTGVDLLRSIVEAAARIFGAAAASIALVDESRQVLEFKVAYGASSETLAGLCIPLDQGLAGYVCMTGQPIAVHNVQQDPRFNQDFARSTGYMPRSILATPLFSGERVIGVMEVLDKIVAPTFGMQDMELLGLFARQAAMAINQSQLYDRLGDALVSGLSRLVTTEDRELASSLDSTLVVPQDEMLRKIAERFYAISQMGESEQQACLEILGVFEQYAKRKREGTYLY